MLWFQSLMKLLSSVGGKHDNNYPAVKMKRSKRNKKTWRMVSCWKMTKMSQDGAVEELVNLLIDTLQALLMNPSEEAGGNMRVKRVVERAKTRQHEE